MCDFNCSHTMTILLDLFQHMMDDICFHLLTPVASPFNIMHKGGKEGFCSPYPASSALFSVCSAPFAGTWVSLFLKTVKYSLKGKRQEHIKREDKGEPGRTKSSYPPKLYGLGRQVPKGSRPWRLLKPRLLGSRGDFKGFLTAQDVFARPKASLKKKIWHCKKVFCRETIHKPLCQHYASQQLDIWKNVYSFCSNKILHLKAKAHFCASRCSLSREN